MVVVVVMAESYRDAGENACVCALGRYQVIGTWKASVVMIIDALTTQQAVQVRSTLGEKLQAVVVASRSFLERDANRSEWSGVMVPFEII